MRLGNRSRIALRAVTAHKLCALLTILPAFGTAPRGWIRSWRCGQNSALPGAAVGARGQRKVIYRRQAGARAVFASGRGEAAVVFAALRASRLIRRWQPFGCSLRDVLQRRGS